MIFDSAKCFDILRKMNASAEMLRAPSPEEIFYLDQATGILASSPCFDRDFYLQNNPDVKASGMDPVFHYMIWGGVEGRIPSAGWSGYYKANPDIAAAQMNPLLHYELFGRAAGRPIGLRGIAYVDVLDKCQLACPNCYRGVQLQKNTGDTMPIKLFRAIAARLKRENYKRIGLFNWTEPFLLRSLDEYVAVVKELGVQCEISSNLSHPPSQIPSIIRTLTSGVDTLIVSISGFTQAIYEIYHKNGRIDWVMDNLKVIAATGAIKTEVRLRFLKWDHNQHEIDLCANVAKELCIQFEICDASGNPSAPIDSAFLTEIVDRLASPVSTVEERARIARASGKICPLIAETIAIDAAGDVYECCAYPNIKELKIGRYLELSDDEILLRRLTHPVCAACGMKRRDCAKDDDARLARLV